MNPAPRLARRDTFHQPKEAIMAKDIAGAVDAAITTEELLTHVQAADAGIDAAIFLARTAYGAYYDHDAERMAALYRLGAAALDFRNAARAFARKFTLTRPETPSPRSIHQNDQAATQVPA
jgi:hypothetical protein